MGSGIGGMHLCPGDGKASDPRPGPRFAAVHPDDDRQHRRRQRRHQLLRGRHRWRAACATSTNSIGEAYRAIKHGYADAINAGGSNSSSRWASRASSAARRCAKPTTQNAASLPFDKRRARLCDGRGRGHRGIGDLRRREGPRREILGEIIGYGNTCDAYHITAPHPEAVGGTRAIEQALREAGGIEGLLYINAHGTGTPLNDKLETLAIKNALGVEAAHAALISSTKSMTGHMLGAWQAVELITSTRWL